MAAAARSLTWFVTINQKRNRSLCLQAASPSRLRSFILNQPDYFVIERPFPQNAEGRELDEDERRKLSRQLQRNAGADNARAFAEVVILASVIEEIVQRICDLHGIDRHAIGMAGYAPPLARARIELAHTLKSIGLSKAEIATTLKLKHTAGVTYLLSQPRHRKPQETDDQARHAPTDRGADPRSPGLR